MVGRGDLLVICLSQKRILDKWGMESMSKFGCLFVISLAEGGGMLGMDGGGDKRGGQAQNEA